MRITITTDEECAAALGLSERATAAEMEAAITKHAQTARDCHDPALLDLLTRDVEAKLRERHGDDFDLLRPDAVVRAKQRAEEEWRQRGRDAQAAADAATAYLRQRVAASVEAQKVLASEAAQTHTNRTERLLSQLVDLQGAAAAGALIDRMTPEQALTYYEAAADDGPDRAFVRTFERLHAAGALDLKASKDPMRASSQISAAIEARRSARVRPSDVALLERLERLRVDLDKSSGDIARGLAVAGKAGALPRGARPTTPGLDDGRRAH